MNISRRPTPLTAATDACIVLSRLCHDAAVEGGWWNNLHTGEDLRSAPGDLMAGFPPKRNVPELLCLVHSEISEAMEGYRKGINDDKLPHRLMLEVELADAAIRIFDMAAGLGLDLPGALAEKLAFNKERQDHKIESRLAAGGKKF